MTDSTFDEKYPQEPPPSYTTAVNAVASSTTAHAQSDKKHDFTPPTAPMAAPRTYEINTHSLSRDFITIRAEGSSADDYLCRTPNMWSMSKPNVVLHAGSDKAAPVVACGRLRSLHHPVIALGDPAGPRPDAVEWEKLKTHCTWRGRYTFEARVGGARRAFAWEPVRGTDSWRQTLGCEFRLVDAATDATVATLSAKYGWELVNKGMLRFEAPVPPELETWTLISCCMCLVVAAMRQAGTAAAVASA